MLYIIFITKPKKKKCCWNEVAKLTFDVKYRLGSIKVPGAGSVSRRDDDSSKFEAATICFAVFLITLY